MSEYLLSPEGFRLRPVCNIQVFDTLSGKMKYRGYIERESILPFDPEELWHLCNWQCWADKKPTCMHTKISVCNHGICFYHPMTKKFYLALSVGWLIGNLLEIKQYIHRNRNRRTWWEELQ